MKLIIESGSVRIDLKIFTDGPVSAATCGELADELAHFAERYLRQPRQGVVSHVALRSVDRLAQDARSAA